MFGIALQRAHHDAGIVAIAQIAECLPAMGKGVQDKRTVTDTLDAGSRIAACIGTSGAETV